MKFLLDMGLARSTADFLRHRGYDAVHLREQGLQRMDDHDIVSKAHAEGRVILTHDLDFGRIIALSQSRLPSVVTFRLSDMRPSRSTAIWPRRWTISPQSWSQAHWSASTSEPFASACYQLSAPFREIQGRCRDARHWAGALCYCQAYRDGIAHGEPGVPGVKEDALGVKVVTAAGKRSRRGRKGRKKDRDEVTQLGLGL